MRNRNPNFSAARTRARNEDRQRTGLDHRPARTPSLGSRFSAQVVLACAFAGLIAWNAAPQMESVWTVSTSSPEEIARRQSSVYYNGCSEVRAAGAAPLYAGDPGYRAGMDGDSDGIACEPYR